MGLCLCEQVGLLEVLLHQPVAHWRGTCRVTRGRAAVIGGSQERESEAGRGDAPDASVDAVAFVSCGKRQRGGERVRTRAIAAAEGQTYDDRRDVSIERARLGRELLVLLAELVVHVCAGARVRQRGRQGQVAEAEAGGGGSRTLGEDGRGVLARAEAGEVLADLHAGTQLAVQQVVLVQEHCAGGG